MSRKLPAGQRPPGAGTALGAVAALLGAAACFVGCATEVSALGREHQTSSAVLIVVAAAFAAGAVVLVRVAIRLEHRFRSGGAAAPAGGPHAARPTARCHHLAGRGRAGGAARPCWRRTETSWPSPTAATLIVGGSLTS
jgi:hypothetical protein